MGKGVMKEIGLCLQGLLIWAMVQPFVENDQVQGRSPHFPTAIGGKAVVDAKDSNVGPCGCQMPDAKVSKPKIPVAMGNLAKVTETLGFLR